MQRREFLWTLAGTALAARIAAAAEPLAELRITRVTGFDVPCRRSKVAGRNSRLDVHGDRIVERMIRLETDAGFSGLGNLSVGAEQAAQLVGCSPAELFDAAALRFGGPLGVGTAALWDLAGRAQGRPVYELLGGAGPERVPVYDGSLYFCDLLPEFADNWPDRVRAELDESRALGHTAVKAKIGRGFKWMERTAGDRRDVELLELVRAHGGGELHIGIDANNGYDLAGAKRLFERIGPLRIDFAEEMFPEQVDDCLALKEFFGAHGWSTLVADGETQGDLDVFRPFIEHKAIDIYQADMKRFGFEGILTEAGWAAEQGLTVAPHNWGSWLGYYLQLHVGRAIGNFYRAEHDPLSTDLLVADGYSIADGLATVPDAPGLGLQLDERRLGDAKIHFDVRA